MLSSVSLVASLAFLASTAIAQDTVSSSQYWHERYHGLLSMAAYGDWQTLCPQQTFTQAALLKSFPSSTEAPFTVLSEWGPTASGISGFNVIIPEMDKVVMVFKGFYGWEQLNMTATTMPALNLGCANCTAHTGAYNAYLEAKAATNDWADVKASVLANGHQWSVTGHGFGGMVSQIAALDLGWRGLCHWTHNHGSPRVFNKASADLYDSLFQGEASQRTVANSDVVPTIIPESADYTFTLQGFHIYGTNTTYGMNYDICASSPTDPNCLGGNNATDHEFYYTPIGMCGGNAVFYNGTYQASVLASESSAFYATATSTFTPTTASSTVASSSSVPSSAVVTSTATSAPATGTAAAGSVASPSTSTKASSSAGNLVVERTVVALVLVAVGVMVLV